MCKAGAEEQQRGRGAELLECNSAGMQRWTRQCQAAGAEVQRCRCKCRCRHRCRCKCRCRGAGAGAGAGGGGGTDTMERLRRC